jgi:alpha-ribazole phosphatase
METAAALGFTPQPEPRFREQHFGDWTGRRHDDLARELGEAYAAFWRAPAQNRPRGGESFADQITRVGEALSTLPQNDVVLVVHSGTVRAALAIALDLPPEPALRFVIDPLSLTRIDRIAESWRVVGVNR